MRTPAGKECTFYYADYFRGSETQECRLIDRNPEGGRWKPSLCKTCPVPGILRQNACPNLVLEAKVEKSLLGLREQVKIYAVCSKYMTEVAEPEIGCGRCHEELQNLRLSD
jgi:hypothetical protein